jgi:hypothetical protein
MRCQSSRSGALSRSHSSLDASSALRILHRQWHKTAARLVAGRLRRFWFLFRFCFSLSSRGAERRGTSLCFLARSSLLSQSRNPIFTLFARFLRAQTLVPRRKMILICPSSAVKPALAAPRKARLSQRALSAGLTSEDAWGKVCRGLSRAKSLGRVKHRMTSRPQSARRCGP